MGSLKPSFFDISDFTEIQNKISNLENIYEKKIQALHSQLNAADADKTTTVNKIKHALPRFEQVLNGDKAKIYNSPDIVDLYVWTKPIGEE